MKSNVFIKVCDVINSCQTIQQLASAKKYAELYISQLRHIEHYGIYEGTRFYFKILETEEILNQFLLQKFKTL